MRRIFAVLLATPLLANCSDAVTPVAPSKPLHSLEVAPLGDGWTDSAFDNWTLDDWTLGASTPEDSPLQVAPGTGALMEFGNPEAGSNFPPGAHDASYHGRDRVNPATVVIDAGQPVTFRVYPGHRVAIYKPGKRPEDVSLAGPSIFILDPVQRLALQAAPVPVISFTFIVPGRYLVLCAVKPHFDLANMYGWVIVR